MTPRSRFFPRFCRPVFVRLAAVFLAASLLLSACDAGVAQVTNSELPEEGISAAISVYAHLYGPEIELGPRPAQDLATAVEYYMRQYQPGPTPRLFQTTYLYDRNGELLARLFDEGHRTWVSLDRISPHLIHATVASEDASFYQNSGIDSRRIAGATLQNLESDDIVSGASTITMQLVRNIFLDDQERFDQTVDRKLLEIKVAQQLTQIYSKDELLEMYLNLVNYGHLAYGIEAAAQIYFDKQAADLNLAEATLLAGIPQQPATLDPVANFEASKERQRIVLDLMVRHGYLEDAEADEIFSQPVTLGSGIQPVPVRYPHYVQFAQAALNRRLGIDDVRRSGLHIVTTLAPPLQDLAQSTVVEWIGQLGPRYGMTNAALVAMQPGSGDVLALVGSLDFDDEAIDGQVNVALSLRQPGSAIKPVFYATALSENAISPATVLWDTPVEYGTETGVVYRPRNYDNRFHGLVTARTALANSYNVPAVKLLSQVGLDRMLAGVRALGLRSLVDEGGWYGLSVVLGGNEITLLELTTAFRTLANGGLYTPPNAALSVTDSQGRPVALPPMAPVQAVTEAAAFQVTDILSDNEARTPMFGANSALRLSRPAAAKTGTTSDWRDNWTVGYTRYLVTGIWSGNSDGRPLRGSTGASGAAPIWRAFMEAIIADPELLALLGGTDDPAAWEFVPPPDVEQRPDCPLNLSCRTGGEYFSRTWLAATGEAGPLADSLATAEMVPVHSGQAGNAYGPFYCSQAGGEMRTLLRLENIIGLGEGQLPELLAEAPSPQEKLALVDTAQLSQQISLPEADADTLVEFFPEPELVIYRNLVWAARNGIQVNLGQCDGLNFYEVQPDDTWSRLASRTGLTTSELQVANPHLAGYLRQDARLLLPRSIIIDRSQGGSFYTVQSGDTWSDIARQHNVSLRLLLAANPSLVRPALLIQPDDQVFIPDLPPTIH